MFTVRQMRYFDALATTRHFGEAAQRVGVSQPALSVQIAEMEKIVGAPLFDRLPKSIALTALGRQFHPAIRRILDGVNRLNEIAKLSDDVFQGTLRLGIIPTLAPYLLPTLLPTLSKHYPELSIEIREEKTFNLADDMSAGRVDVVLAAEPFPYSDAASQPLFFDPFFLATSVITPHYRAAKLAQDEVDTKRLLLLEDGHCLRDQSLNACRTQQYRQDITATSLSTLLQLVANGLGETIVPQSAIKVENRNNSLKLIPFARPVPGRQISLFWRHTSRLHKDFKALGILFAEALSDIFYQSTLE